MNHAPGHDDLQLADYLGVLRRRWWLIIVVAFIGTLGAAGYFKVAHKVYTGTASVYVTAPSSGTAGQVANSRTTSTVNLDTEAQVVQSATVAQAADKLMHSTDNVQRLLHRVSVTVPANSQVLSISCEAATPDDAASCAQAFAQAYLNYSTNSTTASLKSQIRTLQSNIAALESDSGKLKVAIANLPDNSPERASDNIQLSSDHSQLNSLNGQIATLTANLADPSGGSIISNATAPLTATSPKALLIIPSGLLGGLLIGLVLAYLVDRRDRRIRGSRDITRLNVPVLMSLPLRKFTPELAIAEHRSPTGRGFSELAHMLTGSLGAGSHVILVTGSVPGYGASMVAANLAAALSRHQPDVTLVCGDLESSVIPQMAGVRSGRGLTDVLAGLVPAEAVGRHPAAAPRLTVITPGTAPTQAEDLRQDAVEYLLNGLRGEDRWVIIEAAPVTSDPDVYTLAVAADAAILVAETPRTNSDQVLDGVEHLDRLGTTVLGTVLLPSPRFIGPRPVPIFAAESTVEVNRGSAAALTVGGTSPETNGTGPEARADAGQPEAGVSDWPAGDEASPSLPGR
jgi:capsular polysaccharide biosynthesis protein/MinD-like ATPase involved in chromosome partitioning or flagellar assembly